jgi:hypothetical protein
MSDQACKSEEQHRIDTLQEMANTEHQLRMARTQYESAKHELVRAAEALLEWQGQWDRERRAVFACYPDAMPVDSVLEDARVTIDRFCADIEARHAAYGNPAPIPEPDLIDKASVAREQLETDHALPPSADDVVTDLQGDTVEEMREAFEDVFEAQAAPIPQPEWNEPQPEGYAPVTNPEAHIQAVEAERYAQPTNPEADALAKAHDWYDPKAVAERNRFNPWGIFKREKEDA